MYISPSLSEPGTTPGKQKSLSRSRKVSAEGQRFDKLFSHHVGLLLDQQCRTMGLFVALDLRTFTEAHDSIMQTALGRGALHLSPAAFVDLEDRITSRLSEQACSHDAAIAERRAVADRVAVQLRPWLEYLRGCC